MADKPDSCTTELTREKIAAEMYNSVVKTLAINDEDEAKAPRWEEIGHYTQANYLICADVAIKYIMELRNDRI